nr:dihydropyrimidinase [Tanacetum cinerariifolium]
TCESGLGYCDAESDLLSKILIKGGTVVNTDHQEVADVYVEDGVIVVVRPNIKNSPVAVYCIICIHITRYACDGARGIDPHTYLAMEFMATETIDNFFIGQAAALAGGTTMHIKLVILLDGSLSKGYEAYVEKSKLACMDYDFNLAITKWDDIVTREMEITVKEKGRGEIQDKRLSLTDIMVLLAEPLSSKILIGEASTSTTPVTTKPITTISTTFPSFDVVPPLSISTDQILDTKPNDVDPPALTFEKEELATSPEDSNEKKLIQMIKIHTDKNVADLLTKAFDVDENKVNISEASIRRDLRFGDKGGVDCFSNEVIFEQLTLMGGEDRIQLKELMELCTNLQQRVFDLETTKASQAHEVELSARVKSFANEESFSKEDASKQGRISDIDDIQDIYLDLQGKEVVVKKEVAGKDVSAVEDNNAASIATSVTSITPTISMDEITLAKALIEIKT